MTLEPPRPPSPAELMVSLAERLARITPTRRLGTDQARAAVALVLRQRRLELEVLLIRRAEREGDPWSGHVGLPGGRSSPLDKSLVDTARRETMEEVGLCLATHGKLLGSLDDLPAVARGRRVPLVITPFVFELVGQAELTNDPAEVDEAFWATIAELRSKERQSTYPITEAGQSLDLPAIRVGRHLIWGLTLRMLRALFEVMGTDSMGGR